MKPVILLALLFGSFTLHANPLFPEEVLAWCSRYLAEKASANRQLREAALNAFRQEQEKHPGEEVLDGRVEGAKLHLMLGAHKEEYEGSFGYSLRGLDLEAVLIHHLRITRLDGSVVLSTDESFEIQGY